MDLTKDIRRGEEAQRLLENPIFREAVDGIKAAIIEKWEICPIRDYEGQKELKLMLKLLNDLESNIIKVVSSGKIADFDLKSLRERDEMQRKLTRYL